MFKAFNNKNTEETEQPKPTLLGNDFETFPDITDENGEKYHYSDEMPAVPEPVEEPEPEEEPEEERDPEYGMNNFQKAIHRLSEKKWKTIQIIIGIVLGLIACAVLVIMTTGISFSVISVVCAAIIAGILPGMFENFAKRSAPYIRKFILFTVLFCFVCYLIYGIVLNPGYFETIEIKFK